MKLSKSDLLERIAELLDAQATAFSERVLAEIDGRLHHNPCPGVDTGN